jgi:hypothetical protein
MKPHLVALNINGMVRDGENSGRKILPLAQGDLDLSLLKMIRESGWRGPIGILNHTDEDAEARLHDNLEGLDWLVAQLDGEPAPPKPTPRSYRAPGEKKSASASKDYWMVEDHAVREALLTKQGVKKTGTENFGGAICTAGGLIFCAGTCDSKMRAFDKDTGAELWSAKLPWTGTAPPATYEVNGRQFVVIAATGGGKLGMPTSDAYVAFALPAGAR